MHYIFCEFREELLGGQAVSQVWNANDHRNRILSITVQLFIELREYATTTDGPEVEEDRDCGQELAWL